MSQYSNFPYQTAHVSNVVAQNSENLVDILENLIVFLSASANLARSLKETIEIINMESIGKPESCTCPSTCEYLVKRANESGINGSGLQNELVLASPLASSSVKEENIESELTKNDITMEDSTFVTTTEVFKGDTGLPDSTYTTGIEDSKEQSVDTIVMEPKYENSAENKSSAIITNKDPCNCETKSAKPKSLVNDSKSQTKQSPKSSKNRKQLAEKFAKEKTEKLATLKESVTIAQKNLSDIQEQLRQLERLFQDYDSVNTPEGQVNPAALYKEIMKPQSVPYVSFTKSSTPSIQTTQKGVCNYCSPCQSISFHSPELTFKNRTYSRNTQEKVSVLSAVPLDQAFY